MLDFDFVHLVGVGERELAVEVEEIALFENVASGFGTIALDVYGEVFHVDFLVAAIVDGGCDGANRQFSALFTPHFGRFHL